MQDPDPQTPPGEDTGLEAGLSQESQEPVASVGPAFDETAQRLKELEEKNRELQRRLTQQGRELAEVRRSPSTSKTEAPLAFFENPEAVLDAKLRDFEQRQEQRRQAEEMLREFAEEKGIPVRELIAEDKLQEIIARTRNGGGEKPDGPEKASPGPTLSE